MARLSPMQRKFAKIKRQRSLALQMLEHALGERDMARYVATGLMKQLKESNELQTTSGKAIETAVSLEPVVSPEESSGS